MYCDKCGRFWEECECDEKAQKKAVSALSGLLEGTCTSAASCENQEPVTVESLLAAKKMMDEKFPDPIAQCMREKGFDPNNGGILFLHESMRREMPFIPSYVRFSSLIDAPLLIDSRVVPGAF